MAAQAIVDLSVVRERILSDAAAAPSIDRSLELMIEARRISDDIEASPLGPICFN
jgi:hypothetical protein